MIFAVPSTPETTSIEVTCEYGKPVHAQSVAYITLIVTSDFIPAQIDAFVTPRLIEGVNIYHL